MNIPHKFSLGILFNCSKFCQNSQWKWNFQGDESCNFLVHIKIHFQMWFGAAYDILFQGVLTRLKFLRRRGLNAGRRADLVNGPFKRATMEQEVKVGHQYKVSDNAMMVPT